MQVKITVLFLILLSFPIYSQNYFQQKVDYKIEVTLNDKDHSLLGKIEMDYLNNSPDELDKIMIHLWPNAYSGKDTELAKQIYRNGNKLLYYGPDSVKGCIDLIEFSVDNQIAAWNYHPDYKDVAIIQLAQKLKPGQKITIKTPFQVKIPSGEISRLGHVGQSYQITQWYPKPAVYDTRGWHPMPYLSQGEFFSEYGSFDVKITLPKNYIVGSTGDLQTQAEIDFLNDKAAKDKAGLAELIKSKPNNNFPASSEEMKTLHYKQDKVHDFGWFADKRFVVIKDSVQLPHSKRWVTTWAMSTPRNAAVWENASEYLRDGTYYYSLWNGDYPYNHVTAIDGTISAGGGMEYPNVTVIGNAGSKNTLEIVIVHEVGHNWFYGILGSNERDHGWMDEGLNTLNEIRYIQTKYPGNTRLSDMVLNGKFHMDGLDYQDQSDLQVRLITRLGEDQPIETKSPDFNSINYGIVMYQKTGLVFHYLKAYLGDSLFDVCMKDYFETWKFKHPYPADLRAVFEKNTGKNLQWFFDDIIQTRKHIDYQIAGVRKENGQKQLLIKSKGEVQGPASLTFIHKDRLVEKWVEFDDKGKALVAIPDSTEIVRIDIDKQIPETNRGNNYINLDKALFHKIEPLKLEFLIGDKESNRSNLFWSPLIAYNEGDKMMYGLLLHNMGIPFKPLQYYFAPMYSTKRNGLSGQGEIYYTCLPVKTPGQTKFGLHMRTYKFDSSQRGISNTYSALLPYFSRSFKQLNPNKHWNFDWGIKTLLKTEDLSGFVTQSVGGQNELSASYISTDFEMEYSLNHEMLQEVAKGNKGRVNRTQASARFELNYLRNKSTRKVELRLYAGKIWDLAQSNLNDRSYLLALSGANGDQDLFYDEVYFNRSPYQGIQSSIRQENMGGFKSTNELASKDWLTSVNLYMDFPISFLGLGVFGDYAMMPMMNQNKMSVQSFYNAGLGIRIRKVFRVYFPLVSDQVIKNELAGLNYMQKIRFTLNLNILNRKFQLSNIL